MCVILRVDYLFAIGLDMPIAVAQAIYLLERTADGSSVQVGERYLPKNSTKLLRKFKKTTTKLQQTKTYIYSNSASAAITTLNIDFM